MKELKNDIYDDETFFLSVDPEIIIRHKESFIKYILSDNPKYEDVYPLNKDIDKFIGKG